MLSTSETVDTSMLARRLAGRVLGAVAVLGLFALGGCSMPMMAGADLANPEVDPARGQMILFVGTAPETLESDLYLAQAVDLAASPTDPANGPDIVEAESFLVENLTGSLAAELPSFASNALELFSSEAPFPIPDRTGTLVALLATGQVGGPSEGSGQLLLLDVDDRSFVEGPLIEGLFAAHFTWNGGYVALEHHVGEDQVQTSILPTLNTKLGATPALADPTLNVRFAGLERGSNRLLLEASSRETGVTDILLLDPESGEFQNLTEDLDATVSDPTLSPDGTQLALTVTDPESGQRSVHSFSLDTSEDGGPGAELGPSGGAECFWPAWQPIATEGKASKLVCVCQNLETERPDIAVWTPGSGIPYQLSTSGPQPEIFEGTMTGLTVRSRPQWDPQGELVVFGASTREEALQGEAMTLLALPMSSTSAYPVFTANEGSSSWAHFSSALPEPNLLVWDRAETGLYDTLGYHPIQVVVVDDPSRPPHPIVLGQDLFVAYPQYLGANTMLYP